MAQVKGVSENSDGITLSTYEAVNKIAAFVDGISNVLMYFVKSECL